MRANTVSAGPGELIGTIDIGQLHEFRWPFMRILARRYVEEMEMGRYMRTLLATRRWAVVRMVPHSTREGALSTRKFDVYGVSAESSRGQGPMGTANECALRTMHGAIRHNSAGTWNSAARTTQGNQR
jgi:hypothetical protein